MYTQSPKLAFLELEIVLNQPQDLSVGWVQLTTCTNEYQYEVSDV